EIAGEIPPEGLDRRPRRVQGRIERGIIRRAEVLAELIQQEPPALNRFRRDVHEDLRDSLQGLLARLQEGRERLEAMPRRPGPVLLRTVVQREQVVEAFQ